MHTHIHTLSLSFSYILISPTYTLCLTLSLSHSLPLAVVLLRHTARERRGRLFTPFLRARLLPSAQRCNASRRRRRDVDDQTRRPRRRRERRRRRYSMAVLGGISPRSRTTPNTTTTTTTTMPPTRAVLARTHGTRLGSARPRYAPLPPYDNLQCFPLVHPRCPAAESHLRRPAITLLPPSRPVAGY